MRERARRSASRLLLTPALVLGVARCTLLNPLEHLQSGLDDPADGSARDGVQDDRDTASDGDAAAVDDDGPGCGVARWPECGVMIVATPRAPGSAIFSLNDEINFSDEETGEIWKTKCTATSCLEPTLRVSGEVAPSDMAFVSNLLLWTTPTAVRRLKIIGVDASASVPETLDTLSGPARIAATYPHVIWGDTARVRGWSVGGKLVTYLAKAGTSPWLTSNEAFFVAEDMVKRCTFDAVGTPSKPTDMPGSMGAVAITWAPDFSDPLDLSVSPLRSAGAVAALSEGSGSRLVFLDVPDDAGVPKLLTQDPSAIVSMRFGASYLYWTTTAGELRRLSKESATAATMLRGLSGDTRLDMSENVLLITDRGAKRVLRYVPP